MPSDPEQPPDGGTAFSVILTAMFERSGESLGNEIEHQIRPSRSHPNERRDGIHMPLIEDAELLGTTRQQLHI
jgi:hypothetical protein